MDIDAEIAAAMKRIERSIGRRIHFAARSAGQRARRNRERGLVFLMGPQW